MSLCVIDFEWTNAPSYFEHSHVSGAASVAATCLTPRICGANESEEVTAPK